MVYVSKNPMNPRVAEKVRRNLARALFSERSDSGQKILDSLLTRAEKIMLAKRFAIILMLLQGYSTYRISKTLKVSVSTVLQLDDKLSRGKFKPVQNLIGTTRQRPRDRSLVESLELLLAAGLPSIAGPRNQRRLEYLRKHTR